MPEIPDLEAIRTFLNPRLPGLTVTTVEVRYPWTIRSTDGLDSVVGHQLTEVTRLGKYLEFHIDDGRLLVVNPMLTGRFHWAEPGDRKRPGTCVLLALDDGHELRYSDARRMGRWYITTPETIASDVPQIGELGPDALRIEEEDFLTRLKRHRGQAKNTLTNQRFIAGIGNAYSDEILHRARLSPFKRTAGLADDEVERLLSATVATLTEWRDRLIAEVGEGFPDKVTAFRPGMAVHGRYGEPCPVCGRPVQRILYAENEANYCAECQTGGKVLADRVLSRLLKDDWPRTLEELEERRPGPPPP
jgi:formamidopyrimidine-DNA glycosylase